MSSSRLTNRPLDQRTEQWGVEITAVELKDIELPKEMQRAMARQAEAEREKRAKIIAAEGEALAADALGAAADIMMAHPLALQLRNLQSLVEIGVDKNTTVVFPAPLMSTIGELGAFLARETAAAAAFSHAAASAFAPVVPASTGSDHKYEMRSEHQPLEPLHVSFIIGSYSVITLCPLWHAVAGEGT